MDVIETKLNALEDIKFRALYIEKRFMSNNPEEAMLQDRFCDEYRDFITPPMTRAVKKDFNTFLALIEWASDYYKKAGD